MAWHQEYSPRSVPGPSAKELRQKPANYCLKRVKEIREAATASPYSAVPLDLTISPQADELIERLADKLGVSKPEVLASGLVLLDIAMKAKEGGERLAIVDESGKITGEIGF